MNEPISSLIERLRTRAHERVAGWRDRNVVVDVKDCLEWKAAEALSLTVSPPPEEIADLIERLEQRPCTPLSELRTEAAAALQRLAQEVERRKERETTWEWAVRGKDKQIGELFDAAKEQGDEIDRLRTRIAELEAERAELITTAHNLQVDVDAIRAKTFEECAALCDHHDKPLMAARIRALAEKPEDTPT